MLADGKSILLVEDSRIDETNVRRVFMRVGIENPLQVARTGQDALDLLRPNSVSGRLQLPGLILLDLNMPGTDGREVLSEIKRDPQLRTIPVIVLTTSSDERDIEDCYAAGANSYVQKPVGLDGLVDAVQRLHDYWFEIVVFPKKHD